ncbi:hypothetical protein A4H97_22830 [Niastella yeongjuensis]|uniref:DUF2269 domain-containing protein n=1 Tax=Niastella yeongjuensis TaxID=354355 RepID=A0A1V9F7R9_9BACT|nr:DUF2214 family protein [Niastella yeongjuensis]OQP54321.1 hypothetical protein A4H97_22830 [Niastella yeongjuensis]SEP30262.1 Predicted membrane protein [Niastella yeongjuensis]
MYTQTVRQLLLIMHLSGLILMVGTTVAAFVTFRAFTNRVNVKSDNATGLLQLLTTLDPIKGIGGILLILSGLGLTFITGWVFLHMLWLQLKLSLVLLLPLNEILIGKKQLKKLKAAFFESNPDSTAVIKKTVPKIARFYTIQLLLFLAILVIAVLKFN